MYTTLEMLIQFYVSSLKYTHSTFHIQSTAKSAKKERSCLKQYLKSKCSGGVFQKRMEVTYLNILNTGLNLRDYIQKKMSKKKQRTHSIGTINYIYFSLNVHLKNA